MPYISHNYDLVPDDSTDSVSIQPQYYQPTLPLLASDILTEWRDQQHRQMDTELARHRKANLRKPRFSRYGGLRILRLGRLTVQWSWRRQP